MARRRSAGSPFSLFSFQDIITSVTAIIILVALMLMLELMTRRPKSAAGVSAAAGNDLRREVSAIQAEVQAIEEKLKLGQAQVNELVSVSAETLTRQQEELEAQLKALRQKLERITKEKAAAQQALDATVVEHLEKQQRQKGHLDEIMKEAKRCEDQKEDLKKRKSRIFSQRDGSSKQSWLVEISASGIQVRSASAGATPESFASEDAWFAQWVSLRSPRADYFLLLLRPSGSHAFHSITERLDPKGFEYGYDILGEDAPVETLDQEEQP